MSSATASTLAGKVAIVTGGGSGLGREIALEYAAQGAAVVVSSNVPDQDEAVAQQCRRAGGRAVAVSAEVTDEAEVQSLVDRCVAEFDGLDILVAAAGVDIRESLKREERRIRSLPIDVWRQVLEINLTGTFLCARAVIAPMAERGGGSIVTLTSGTVSKPLPGLGAYVSSKAGIEGLTRVLACEVSADRIRANILQPGGPTNTPFFDGFIDGEERAQMHQPSIIRGAAVYLASDASRAVTGDSIVAADWNRDHGLRLCACPTCAS